MIKIDVLQRSPEDLELYWLAGLRWHPKKGWLVGMVTRGVSTGKLKCWWVPIGLLPVLALGYRFSDGCMLKMVYGNYSEVIIPRLVAGEEITSGEIPSGLYSFGDNPGGVQRLLRYRINGMEYLIPTMELIRCLFLHNKTLANNIMQPGGVMTLFSPEQPGFHPSLQLDFTRQMPVKSLNKPFVMEFSWLAVDIEGQRAWDSVYECSVNQEYMSLDPPDLGACVLKFRGVKRDRQWLVLEISGITGKNIPCNVLYFSHPLLGKTISVPMPRGQPKRGTSGGGSSQDDAPVVNTSGFGSKTDVHQPQLSSLLTRTSIFDRDVEVHLVHLKDRIRTLVRRGKGVSNGDKNGSMSRKHPGIGKQRGPRASVSPESSESNLPPTEFRILDIAKNRNSEDLERLMRVIEVMTNGLKDVRVLKALCQLKVGRAFSMVGGLQRLCLVAVFFRKEKPPVVLLDVEHSGKKALSTMLIRFKQDIELNAVEDHVQLILDKLIYQGGQWDVKIDAPLDNDAVYERLPKVMRPKLEGDEDQNTASWAAKLSKKIFNR